MPSDFETVWKNIMRNVHEKPQEIQTIPLHGGGVWFSVFLENQKIYVSPAANKTPSSKVKPRTYISRDILERMYPIYLRRKNGEQVSQTAQKASFVQVYCYAIFENFGEIK